MKLRTLALAAVMAALLGAPAHAVVAPPTSVELGLLSTDGTFAPTMFNASGLSHNEFTGSLDVNKRVTFTYTVFNPVGVVGSELLTAVGRTPNNSVYVEATADTDGMITPPPSASPDHLILASAALSPSLTMGSTVITNLTSAAIRFSSLFSAWLNKGSSVLVSYTVETVPLPAALPLFGMGLAGLAGLRSKKRKEKIEA